MARRKRYPGSIEARGESLRVILYAGGERHTFTLTTRDRREAEEFAQRKHLELQGAAGRVRRGLPGRLPVSALIDKFQAERLPHLAPNTQRTYKLSLATFREFFDQLADPPVSEVGRGNIADYLSWRRVHRGTKGGGKVGARTVQKDRACLHAVFAYAEEWSYGTAIPSPR